ncbi:SemiSWEET transporter [Desulfovibrio sp. TomC]|uniref:SemiSWEET transporter n=1 Tax=Desulfovibrio sp. TomC TaxID=1562888 RepID=UPI0005BD3852|nr:SemiSWEET transporter [Desulfovibrio sp. TomC]
MPALSDWIGFAAGLCTTAAFAPQVVKTMRSRSTSDISLGMYALMVVGITLWLIHGLAVGSAPVVAANAVTLILVGIMLVMKFRYK